MFIFKSFLIGFLAISYGSCKDSNNFQLSVSSAYRRKHKVGNGSTLSNTSEKRSKYDSDEEDDDEYSEFTKNETKRNRRVNGKDKDVNSFLVIYPPNKSENNDVAHLILGGIVDSPMTSFIPNLEVYPNGLTRLIDYVAGRLRELRAKLMLSFDDYFKVLDEVIRESGGYQLLEYGDALF